MDPIMVEKYDNQMLQFASINLESSTEFVQHFISLGAYSLNEGLKCAAECGNYELVIYFHTIGATNIQDFSNLDERYQLIQ